MAPMLVVVDVFGGVAKIVYLRMKEQDLHTARVSDDNVRFGIWQVWWHL